MGVMERFRSSSDSSGMQFVMVLVIVSFIMMFGTPRGDQTAARRLAISLDSFRAKTVGINIKNFLY